MVFAGGARRRPAPADTKAASRAIAGVLALLALGQPAAATVRCDGESWNTGQWARAVWDLETQGVVLVTGRIMRADLIESGTVQIDNADAPADTARLRLAMTVDEWLVGGDEESPTEITIFATQINGSGCSVYLGLGLRQNLVLTRDDEGNFVLSRRGSMVPTWEWDDVQTVADLYRAQHLSVEDQDPDPDHQGIYAHHLAEAHGIHISHAWVNATDGDTAHVYLDMSVDEGIRTDLRGASAEFGHEISLVRTFFRDGEVVEEPYLGRFETTGGRTDHLFPYGASLLVSQPNRPLVEGEVLDMLLRFQVRERVTDPEEIERRRSASTFPYRVFFTDIGTFDVRFTVDVLAPDALDHPHAVRGPWDW